MPLPAAPARTSVSAPSPIQLLPVDRGNRMSGLWNFSGIPPVMSGLESTPIKVLAFVAENAPTMRPLPGRHPLSREFIAQHQRARIILALAEETEEKGYRAVTVADIVRRAGIARNTFYENFSSKRTASSPPGVRGQRGSAPGYRGRQQGRELAGKVNVGLAAFLNYVAGEPALARTCIVEALPPAPRRLSATSSSIQAFSRSLPHGPHGFPHGEDCPARSRRPSSAASSGSSTSASSWDRRSRSRSFSPSGRVSPDPVYRRRGGQRVAAEQPRPSARARWAGRSVVDHLTGIFG